MRFDYPTHLHLNGNKRRVMVRLDFGTCSKHVSFYDWCQQYALCAPWCVRCAGSVGAMGLGYLFDCCRRFSSSSRNPPFLIYNSLGMVQ
jgi:hypothetical protein